MSMTDEKAHETSADAADREADATGHGDDEILKNGPGGVIILFFILGLAACLVIGWGLFPKLLYSQKKQPVAFNHKRHMAEVENGCESCHYFREDGSFSGIPTLEACMTCHENAIGESDDEAVFMAEYVYKNREVPWYVYARQPDSVFFSHVAHVKMGEIDCKTCHGDIGESEQSKMYEENRITGYSRDIWGKNIAGFKMNTYDRMKMDDCAECHETMTGRRTSVQTQYDACFVCHK
jgi:menaquinone reductase, multiheme cytochrome c subunit